MPKNAGNTKSATRTRKPKKKAVAVKLGRKPGAVEIPDKVSSVMKIAALLGMASPTLQTMVAKKELPGPGDDGMWPVYEINQAYIALLKNEAKGDAAETARIRREQAEADLESAKVDLAKKKGVLIARADCESIWIDGIVRLRQIIEEADYIKPSQKAKLVASIKKTKLAKIDEEE